MNEYVLDHVSHVGSNNGEKLVPGEAKNTSMTITILLVKVAEGASLVTQWLRIRLPMQGTRVQALVREDPTCRGATKPVCHNY